MHEKATILIRTANWCTPCKFRVRERWAPLTASPAEIDGSVRFRHLRHLVASTRLFLCLLSLPTSQIRTAQGTMKHPSYADHGMVLEWFDTDRLWSFKSFGKAGNTHWLRSSGSFLVSAVASIAITSGPVVSVAVCSNSEQHSSSRSSAGQCIRQSILLNFLLLYYSLQ